MKIKSIRKSTLSEPKSFYDITVDKHHNFIISNAMIVTHNSSLSSSIVGMAQNFKNSMPVLEAIGQFGSLRSPESAAARYISTKLHKNFRLLYMDFDLLTPRYEEGNEIEPQYFLPIIPTVLLNGGSGIAVGFATNILNRNPIDLIDACVKALDGKSFKEPTPWYFGFNGPVARETSGDLSWTFRGRYDIRNTTTVDVTELPPSMTYEKFDAYLSDLEDANRITGYENHCQSNVAYTLKFRREDLKTLTENGRLDKFLKILEKDSENFTVLDEHGNLKIFDSAIEIIEYFVKFRLTYYFKRKQHLIDTLTHEATAMSAKSAFIKAIIDGKLKITNTPKAEIVTFLEKNKYYQVNGSYQYLLAMPIHNLTAEMYSSLISDEKAKWDEVAVTKKKDPSEMYRADLLELRKVLVKSY